MSDKYGVHHGVGWGTVDQQAEKANMGAWWNAKQCRTKPTCAAWGCSCQGLSDTYGTYPGNWGNAHGKAGEFWNAKGCATIPNNRCLAKHCNGHWKLKPAAWKIVCPGGNCQTNTNMCCKIDGCDKVRVVDISYKKKDVYVGPPEVKHLSTYTVDGENCGSSQEKPLDSFVRTKSVSITHEESLELGNSLENTFGWSQSQESTIEWSESASMSMEVPLKGASLGMEHSMTKTWSKTSAFAQEGGVTKGANTNKLTAITKQVEETVEFSGISKDVPPYAWYRHRAYYHERPIQMTLTLKVQCIVNGKNAMEKEIPGTKLVTATESVLKFFPMEDLTGNCKNTHSEYGTCKCFGLRSNFHTSTGCQPRMNPDGTTGGRPGCYVYKDAGCTDAIGLKDADPEKFRGDFALIRKISSDYPVDGSMFRWSYMPCDARCKKPTGCVSKTDVYSNIDCDGDGILDHVCTNGGNRWVALSSKGDCRTFVSDKNGKCEGRCKKPTGCSQKTDVYKHIDCDGDGILDHVCTNGGNRWVALSSKGDCKTFVSEKNGKCVGTSRRRSTADRLVDMMESKALETDPSPDHSSAPLKEFAA